MSPSPPTATSLWKVGTRCATTVTRQVQDATGRDVDLRILLTNPTLRDYVQAVAETSAAPTELVSAADSEIEEGTL